MPSNCWHLNGPALLEAWNLQTMATTSNIVRYCTAFSDVHLPSCLDEACGQCVDIHLALACRSPWYWCINRNVDGFLMRMHACLLHACRWTAEPCRHGTMAALSYELTSTNQMAPGCGFNFSSLQALACHHVSMSAALSVRRHASPTRQFSDQQMQHNLQCFNIGLKWNCVFSLCAESDADVTAQSTSQERTWKPMLKTWGASWEIEAGPPAPLDFLIYISRGQSVKARYAASAHRWVRADRARSICMWCSIDEGQYCCRKVIPTNGSTGLFPTGVQFSKQKLLATHPGAGSPPPADILWPRNLPPGSHFFTPLVLLDMPFPSVPCLPKQTSIRYIL